MSKKRPYEQGNVGFKIDIRILYDSRHNEHDSLASEGAEAVSVSKVHGDLTKLFRESKDNLDDSIRHMLNGKASDLSSWFLQANGLHAHLGSVHLTEPGIYTAIHQGTSITHATSLPLTTSRKH
ncbi:hypothetical protein BCR43DRAFT_295738 [Syncephalastrum racemosum]|uniref:Uncharacterized protein n=1 Tax=Syncephalastrum racemosum TaxID=13706 RepID=A0A1X2H982_SYNRA|nr:hypothetical protein BCR43DRAFT_295738 [Syncephalastrum racemosum]